MIEALRSIITSALARLSEQIKTDLPPLIAAVAILAAAYVFARFARWLMMRVFKGIEIDRWMKRTGVSAVIDRSGRLRASRMAAQTVYWLILILGFMTALNAFGTQVTTRMVEGIVFLLPRLVGAVLIVLAGLWLGQHLGRSMLVWAVNEDLPSPRRLALAVRALVVFVAVVVAAETVNFASGVFLAAFIILLGGAVLAASVAIGLGASENVREHFRAGRLAAPRSEQQDHFGERSIWNHL